MCHMWGKVVKLPKHFSLIFSKQGRRPRFRPTPEITYNCNEFLVRFLSLNSMNINIVVVITSWLTKAGLQNML